MVFELMWLPLLISSVLFMPFGAFLYSTKGLGDQWMKAIGKTKEEIENSGSNMGLIMGGTFLLSLLTVFLISILIVSVGVGSFVNLLLLIGVVYLILLFVRLKNVLFDEGFALFKVNILGTLGEFIIVLVVFAFFI